MNKHVTRILAGGILAFFVGFLLALANGRGITTALANSLYFFFVVAVPVAAITWAIEIAKEKGYSAWVGFLAIVALNFLGILVLMALPRKTKGTTKRVE